MKTILATLALSLLASSAFAQGTVVFNNSAITQITTNGTASGLTATAAQGFYYGLFTAAPGTLDPVSFTFTGAYATNQPALGRFTGGSALGVAITGWTAATSRSFIIMGWSSNLGHDWAVLSPQWNNGGTWAGGTGFFGMSSIGTGLSGDPLSSIPAVPLFGGVSGFPTGFVLNFVTAVPEPSTMVLAGLGAASLLLFRRRKQA